MKKSYNLLMFLSMVFAICLVIANIVAAKVVNTGIIINGNEVLIPGAVICYMLTFLVTDIVGEIWGKKEATSIVRFGMIGQVLAMLLVMLTQVMPTPDSQMQEAYNTLLGQNWLFVASSLTAYLVSQSWDVWIFHKIREKMLAKGKTTAWRWVWNTLSTASSQLFDTVLFITLAFGLGMGWLFDPAMRGTLLFMMLGQYIIKLGLALIDTPIFYLITRPRSTP